MLRFIRKNGKRDIGTHRADRFLAFQRHRFNNGVDIFAAVTKNLLISENGGFR